MARTPLASALQDIAAGAHSTRRQFLGASAAAAAAAAAAGPWAAKARAADSEPVVVVGAGLAGLTAAYRLKQAGISAHVHEASTRVGGRCWTIRDVFGDSGNPQVAEHGGELIDTGHTAIRQLCQELRLDLDNLFQAEQKGTEPLYYFDGKPYTYAEAAADFNAVYQQLHKDVSAASYPTTYKISTPRGYELDQMSVVDWINESVPGGIASRFGQLLDVAYNIEYGAESSVQSSLNLLYLLGYSGQGQLRLFGPSNEKFHVRGGNDLIVKGLCQAVGSQIRTGSELIAIARTTGGRYTLTFREGSATRTVTAGRVILALPFSILRASVDYSKAGFSAVKVRAIRELGMGTNAKLNVGFKTRHWRTLGNNGDTYADTGYQATWEVSRAQAGTKGILVDYTGGKIGAAQSGDPLALAQKFLGQLNPVLPGIKDAWDGKATIDHWTSYPWTKGSYSFYKKGQYTAFGAAESEIEGACHFAGEHTTQDFQGYLNGAVDTGQRVASEVLAALK
ncbi:MAG TPA: FAD-dependent oxidoreductase [Solirubrobacteraceae bacterium]|jgi:monoamine oxidase